MAAPDQQTQLQAYFDPEFKIVRLLGEGAMARVYVAREAALRRLVAIKVLNSEVAEDEIARKRFERESRSAAKIRHQNVATVYRVGSLDDETPFMIMEYIEGKNLADALKAEGVMTVEQACRTLGQLASALAAAHENGIVHRDVKPENVVRERDSDRIVLTDFGIAGILETGTETITRLTKQGQLLGDPRYMSPEQLLGESVTDESDVYSLGIMGYELGFWGGRVRISADDPRGGGHPNGHPGGPHAGGVPGDSRSFVDVRYQLEGNPTNRVGCHGGGSDQASPHAGVGG